MTSTSLPAPDLTLGEALRLADAMMRCEPDPDRAGTMRVIRTLSKAVREFLPEEDLIMLQSFVWSAHAEWPAVCDAIGRLLRKVPR